MDAKIDITKLLNDPDALTELKRQRDALDAIIQGVEQFQGADFPSSVEGGKAPTKKKLSTLAEIGPATFYEMSAAAAAKKYLRMCQQVPQSTNAIADALTRGGLKRAGDDRKFRASLHTSMSRDPEIAKIETQKGMWGLKEWFNNKAGTEG